jgi:hypothetical protein
VSLIHALEHVKNPVETLGSVLELFPTASVIIQVPDVLRNPFDLTVADHRSHFTADSLTRVVSAAAPTSRIEVQRILPKELTAVITPEQPSGSNPAEGGEVERHVESSVDALFRFATSAKQSTEIGPLYIFGSSIAASWLAGEIGTESVCAFIDEDPARVGRKHLDVEIVDPTVIRPDARIVIPVAGEGATQIHRRLFSSVPTAQIVTPDFVTMPHD